MHIDRFPWHLAKLAGAVLGTAAGVVVIMLWLVGAFHSKIEPAAVGPSAGTGAGRSAAGATLVPVSTRSLPRVEPAVGTIRPVHETQVASKILAKVLAVHVRAGDQVKEGQTLIELDREDLHARLEQAQATLNAAEAAVAQARIEYDRIVDLHSTGAAPQIELDRNQAALRAAEAEEQHVRQTVREAQTVLAYATIVSPITGTVVDKRVEVGDTAAPGQPLVTLYDPTRMQLVARVRESLATRLQVGKMLGVEVDALSLRCEGAISEIVPEAEAASRTFSVKVTGPCPPGVYMGMFGRLLIPLDEEEVLVVPADAVRRVGQLSLVEVAVGDRLHRRAVQLGRSFGDEFEVLSGLTADEQVAIPSTASSEPARS